MGEQGAKSLRGGKMEDVIFAGTAGRPPLGRAEVALTIDNTDGALPIDYTEVTISRTMFRNGGSEYAINGNPCRLLDVQELLSDSGIGREMHVIVGQGQLDAILHATPEDRRGFIEEAAGVLKHRKRKEKALRKLDAMHGQPDAAAGPDSRTAAPAQAAGPPGRGGPAAAVIQADVRDARLRLLADDLAALQRRAGAGGRRRDGSARAAQRGGGASSPAAQAARGRARGRVARRGPDAGARPGDLVPAVRRCASGSAGTASAGAERVRHLQPRPTRTRRRAGDPDELEAEARDVRRGGRARPAGRARPRRAGGRRPARACGRGRARRRGAAGRRGCSAPRPTVARGWPGWPGRSHAARSRVSRRGRPRSSGCTAQVAEARARAEQAPARLPRAGVAGRRARRGRGRPRRGARGRASGAGRRRRPGWPRCALEEQEAERERAALAARVEALELGLARKDGAAAVLAAGERLPGVLGPCAALLHVEPGYEAAVAAALGTLADAVAVGSLARPSTR